MYRRSQSDTPDQSKRAVNERSVAQLAAKQWHGQLWYVPDWQRWILWAGSEYVFATEAQVYSLLMKTLRELLSEVDSAPNRQHEVKTLMTWAALRRILSACEKLASFSLSADEIIHSPHHFAKLVDLVEQLKDQCPGFGLNE